MKNKIPPGIPAILLFDELGIISPNSIALDRAASRLLLTSEFSGSEIKVEDLKRAYVESCELHLSTLNDLGKLGKDNQSDY